jgi:hypothetical protein
MKLVTAILFCLAVSPVLLDAQVVARQGSPAESPLQDFKSPMVLDLPLRDFKALPFGSGKDFKEVRKYYCEDLVLSQLMLVKKEDSHRGKPPGVRIEIRGAASVRPSYDRRTTLRFDVLKGEERLATTQVFHLSTEEGKTTPFRAELRLPSEELERLFAEGEPPLLRITVTVEDNS